MTAAELNNTGDSGRLPLQTMLLAAAVGWFILVGGTELGQLNTAVRSINTIIGGTVVAVWLWRMPRRADSVDLLVLGGIVTFLAACVASDHRRMSFDAATTALAFGAAFSVARWEVADPRRGRALVTVLAVCSLGSMLLFLPLWTSIWAQWFSVTGALPELNVILPVGPYRGAHVVAMLFALLLPALIQLTRRRLVNVVGYLAIAISLVFIYMSGSRTVWLAVGIGLLALAARRAAEVTRARWLVAGAVVVAVIAAVLGGFGSILDRLLTASTLELRLAIWRNAIDMWLADPLFGTGPGSFSAAFTLGDYFEQYERVGRHADNAVIQLLMEAGFIGAVGLALLAVAFVIGARRAERPATPLAPIGLGIFVLMSLTDNPSDTANLVVIAICWTALVVPAVRPSLAERWAPSWRTAVIGAGATVVGIACVGGLAASAYFDAAQASARADRPASLASLETAVALDPSSAIYLRERGLYRVALDEPGGIHDLRRALAINPADTSAMRALAVVLVEAGETDEAVRYADRAAALQPTHGENLVTLAWVASEAGRSEVAGEALVELLRRMPWIAAAPTWAEHFPTGTGLRELHGDAADAWSARPDTPARHAMSAVWSTASAGRTAAQLDAGTWEDLRYLQAMHELLSCDLAAAEQAILNPPPSVPVNADLLAMMLVGRAIGDEAAVDEAIALSKLRGSAYGQLAEDVPEPRSPIWDPDDDRRIYHRDGIVPVDLGLALPTEAEAWSAWLHDPRAAAALGAPESGLAACRS